MLWDWFEDESRIGAELMRPNRTEGLSADDFKGMLDEHEASILADIALKQPEPAQSSALSAISNERQRQIDVEGWTHKHDDAHNKGEMAHAAGSYALATSDRLLWIGSNEFPFTWPWHKRWWKPKDRRGDLIKAGALIVAEIERLDRASQVSSTNDQGAAK